MRYSALHILAIQKQVESAIVILNILESFQRRIDLDQRSLTFRISQTTSGPAVGDH